MARRRRKRASSVRRHVFHNGWHIKDSIRNNRSLYIIALIILAVFVIIVGVIKYIADNYTITNVYVNGNKHYTDEEIVEMVMTDKFCKNSMYLSFKYRNKSIRDIPFIEKMDVDIISPDSVKINVYEKAVAGYIAYLGHYMYFDRDGIVVESSFEPSDDVPQVMGLSFDSVIIHEKLPVENGEIFEEILDITQLLEKYELNADKIFFDSEYNVYLYFGGIEVSIGTKDYIDEKIIQLKNILPKPELEGKSGIIEMKDYDEDTKNISFKEKKQ
ncbi:FtsQ-type POTRA domain-containing protein [Butyrivibrio sp. X503]|uniref:cell division protein FtsQ/DivIB n=1 Tax=Butyrivibrio sp. X503 TaxID=2364878 RepID=UPI000EAAAE7E|nr:FtsQ-type POTRA domain-containing protein [Butyrivibrio sp. X503]RKM55671.1 FtsQ-type POTRA domain-containing protein [Butyrivibrio sp. X503]